MKYYTMLDIVAGMQFKYLYNPIKYTVIYDAVLDKKYFNPNKQGCGWNNMVEVKYTEDGIQKITSFQIHRLLGWLNSGEYQVWPITNEQTLLAFKELFEYLEANSVPMILSGENNNIISINDNIEIFTSIEYEKVSYTIRIKDIQTEYNCTDMLEAGEIVFNSLTVGMIKKLTGKEPEINNTPVPTTIPKNYHVIKAKYSGYANTRDSKIILRSDLFKKTKIIPFNDRQYSNTLEIAIDYLQKVGYAVIGKAEGKDCYYIITDTFKSL